MNLIRELLTEFQELRRWQKISIVVGILGFIIGVISLRPPFSERQPTERQPTVTISSPYLNEQTDKNLSSVRGMVIGDVPAGYEILVGHRDTKEQSIAMHADRRGQILPDKSFVVSDIVLGSDSEGVGAYFDVIALLIHKETLNRLHLKDNDNPLTTMPEYLAKAVTTIRRVK